MPLFRVDVYDNYSTKELKVVLDILYSNALKHFRVPKGDRYQIVTKHTDDEIIFEDTGLGFTRTKKLVSIQIFSRKRAKEDKLAFYRDVANELQEKLKIGKQDLMFSFFENGDEDWSFADGKAQFVTGELD